MHCSIWIVILFGVLYEKVSPVLGVGCKTEEQRKRDKVVLKVVAIEGEDVNSPFMVNMVDTGAGSFNVSQSQRVVSKSHDSIYKSANLDKDGLVVTERRKSAVFHGQRLVKSTRQVLNGVDVLGFGATIDVETDEVITSSIAECLFLDITDTKPKITLESAVKSVSRKLRRSPRDKFFPSISDRNSRLNVFVDPNDNGKAKLVWNLNIAIVYFDEKTDRTEPSNAFAVVDARNGKVVYVHEYMETYLMKGDGGNVKIGQHFYGEDRLVNDKLLVEGCAGCAKCVASNPFVEVTSANQTQYFYQLERCFIANKPYEEQCDPPPPSADATNHSFSQVHDALYYATSFREMLRDVYRDKSLDKCSKTGQVKICVHYDHRNLATFKDSGNCEIYFGFGFKYFYDPVSVTLVAHELGHALIKVTSNLEYRCQTGAIAESFSDMCGVVLKAYLNDMKVDWAVGREITREDQIIPAVRFFDDPPRDNVSASCTRDYPWQAPCFQQDPHSYAGIYNKGFYNLATTQNWNVLSAFEVFLRATKFYWQAVDGFDAALCGVIEATIDIYGPQGTDVAFKRASDVSKAFAKVGVFCSVTKGRRKNVADDRIGSSSKAIKLRHKKGCPEGWLTLSNFTDDAGNTLTSCYKVLTDQSTWANAMTYCESLDGHLAIIDSKPLSDWITASLKPKSSYWLGATDLETTSKWKWVPRDVAVTWTDWAKGRPQVALGNHCLAMRTINKKVSSWIDDDCSKPKPFICQLSCCGLQCRRNS